MQTFKLKGQPRENVGKKASKNLRKEGFVPSVLYGRDPLKLPFKGELKPGEKLVDIGGEKGMIVTDFTVSFDEVRKLIYTPDIYLVEIDLKENRTVKAILKEVQFHPVTDAILHVDFLEVFENKPIVMDVPVSLTGHAAGVRSGGKLNQTMRKLKIKGMAENIPEKLEVNIENLELGKVIKVEELAFDNVEIISSKNAVVCTVKMTRATQSAVASATAEAEASEEGSTEETTKEEATNE